ncbi:MAG TPA: hypothetical protein P5567_14740 [Kiritimatiellia bacterium]|nr:hypothetical protein [Kiritimatiellia bacterium]HSA19394.1 hypothetical protein [Kiritimatiellia bacterium]
MNTRGIDENKDRKTFLKLSLTAWCLAGLPSVCAATRVVLESGAVDDYIPVRSPPFAETAVAERETAPRAALSPLPTVVTSLRGALTNIVVYCSAGHGFYAKSHRPRGSRRARSPTESWKTWATLIS